MWVIMWWTTLFPEFVSSHLESKCLVKFLVSMPWLQINRQEKSYSKWELAFLQMFCKSFVFVITLTTPLRGNLCGVLWIWKARKITVNSLNFHWEWGSTWIVLYAYMDVSSVGSQNYQQEISKYRLPGEPCLHLLFRCADLHFQFRFPYIWQWY